MRHSMKRRISSISETLMREFCPPLDSSLIAALVRDIEVDTDSRRTSPTQSQIDELRTTLRELSTQADESQLSELSRSQLTSPTDGSGSSVPDFCHTNSSCTSESSAPSYDSVASVLGFLQATLPKIPIQRLKDALARAEQENDEPDLWNVISNILSDDAIQELGERGLDVLDDGNMTSDKVAWQTGPSKQQKRLPDSAAVSFTKTRRKQKVALLDFRQQHHVRPIPSPPTPGTSAVDPWTMVVSLSEQLSDLIRSHPAAHFQSYFHSPKYSTPYEALCSALKAISDTDLELSAEDTAVFFNLLDILTPEYEGTLDLKRQSNICSDLQLAVSATRGHAEDALDLVRILRDLDCDSAPGRMEIGIYHSPVQTTPSPSSPMTPFRYAAHLPTGPPSPPAPPDKWKPPSTTDENKHQSTEWRTVSKKGFILTEQRTTNHDSTAYIRGNGTVDAGQKQINGLAEFYKRRSENLQKRDEQLQEASRMWRKRNGKSRGAEIAMVFAERARAFQESANEEALNAARARVQAKRCASKEKDTIDLHGTTAAEAIAIVREELENTTYSPSRPLKIVTGRGSHSVNQKSVLKPSIQKALDEDGWSVNVWEGGLIVRGKKTSS